MKFIFIFISIAVIITKFGTFDPIDLSTGVYIRPFFNSIYYFKLFNIDNFPHKSRTVLLICNNIINKKCDKRVIVVISVKTLLIVFYVDKLYSIRMVY